MYNIVMTLLIIVSFLIIIATLMQPQKQQDALNALSGGAVFSGQTKKRGFEALMERITAVLLVLFKRRSALQHQCFHHVRSCLLN
ncbi:preprotein translocase subunit SecG [Lactobacillus gasseri]